MHAISNLAGTRSYAERAKQSIALRKENLASVSDRNRDTFTVQITEIERSLDLFSTITEGLPRCFFITPSANNTEDTSFADFFKGAEIWSPKVAAEKLNEAHTLFVFTIRSSQEIVFTPVALLQSSQDISHMFKLGTLIPNVYALLTTLSQQQNDYGVGWQPILNDFLTIYPNYTGEKVDLFNLTLSL
ncbi:MAG: hypothetical protein ABW189_07650 [Rickettsiales bacterium]